MGDALTPGRSRGASMAANFALVKLVELDDLTLARAMTDVVESSEMDAVAESRQFGVCEIEEILCRAQDFHV